MNMSNLDVIKKLMTNIKPETAIRHALEGFYESDGYQANADAADRYLDFMDEWNLALPNIGGMTDLEKRMLNDKKLISINTLIESENAMLSSASSTLDDLINVITKAKINMELVYKVKRMELLDNRVLSGIYLNNTAPYSYVSDMLGRINKLIETVKDIRGLVHMPVQSDTVLADIKSTYDNIFPSKMMREYISDSVNLLARGNWPGLLRPEYMRPVANYNGVDSGYNHTTVHILMKDFVKTVANLTDLSSHWFHDQKTFFVKKASRMENAMLEIRNTAYPNDTVKDIDGINVRMTRFNMAVFMILDVAAPVLLKEITSFVKVMDTLGQYIHMDAAKVISRESNVNNNDVYLSTVTNNWTNQYSSSRLRRVVEYMGHKCLEARKLTNVTLIAFNAVNTGKLIGVNRGGLPAIKASLMCQYASAWKKFFSGMEQFCYELYGGYEDCTTWAQYDKMSDFNRYMDTYGNSLLHYLNITRVNPDDYTKHNRLSSPVRKNMYGDIVAYNEYPDLAESYCERDTQKTLLNDFSSILATLDTMLDDVDKFIVMSNRLRVETPDEIHTRVFDEIYQMTTTVIGMLEYYIEDVKIVAHIYPGYKTA